MAFTILTTVSDYEEKKRPAKSGKDSILGYFFGAVSWPEAAI